MQIYIAIYKIVKPLQYTELISQCTNPSKWDVLYCALSATRILTSRRIMCNDLIDTYHIYLILT